MKKFQVKKFIVTIGLVAGSLVVAGAALALDTNTMTVSATVNGSSKFQSTTSTLAFGAIDPSSTSTQTANTTTTYRCTTGTTASVTRNNGLNASGGSPRLTDGSSHFIPYTLTLTGGTQVGTGHGAGQDKTLTIDGSIAVADFQNATANTYSDTVILTINP